MNCLKCNQWLPPDSEFCPSCGAKTGAVSYGSSGPVAADLKARPKREKAASKKKSKATIMILFIICLLFYGANVLQYFLYTEAIEDTEQQLAAANKTIADNRTQITELQETVSTQSETINAQKTTITGLEDAAAFYDEILHRAEGEDFGYAAENFFVDTGLIVLGKDDTYRFSLTANWPEGGTVYVDYSSSAAVLNFDDSEWSTSTTMTVYPYSEGVCMATFSNSVDDMTFSVMILVTD